MAKPFDMPPIGFFTDPRVGRAVTRHREVRPTAPRTMGPYGPMSGNVEDVRGPTGRQSRRLGQKELEWLFMQNGRMPEPGELDQAFRDYRPHTAFRPDVGTEQTLPEYEEFLDMMLKDERERQSGFQMQPDPTMRGMGNPAATPPINVPPPQQQGQMPNVGPEADMAAMNQMLDRMYKRPPPPAEQWEAPMVPIGVSNGQPEFQTMEMRGPAEAQTMERYVQGVPDWITDKMVAAMTRRMGQ